DRYLRGFRAHPRRHPPWHPPAEASAPMREPYSAVTEEYELWSCHDIDSTEDEVIELLGSLVRATKPKVCIEVGSHIGLASFAIEIGRASCRGWRWHYVAAASMSVRAVQ